MTYLAPLRQLVRISSLIHPSAVLASVVSTALAVAILTGCSAENRVALGQDTAPLSATVVSESTLPTAVVTAAMTPEVANLSTSETVATATPPALSTQATNALTPMPATAAVPTLVGPETSGLGPFPLPLRVRIPKINVDASIETVGQDANGAMGTPHGSDQVAWYGLGPSPGQSGASVIAGHVDSVHGPAVFWSLQDLRPGDTIDVDLVGGLTRHFVVDRSDWYAPDAAPLQVIFAEGGAPRLNLITCGGVFDRTRHAYDRRLVVFTHLQTLSGATGDLPDSLRRL